jgi:hypothetical protein
MSGHTSLVKAKLLIWL